ncbi:MAG: hypothetical protein NDI62_01555 [Burkholderiales bacterium]|nr:hypothetical protein [Burkholderiales bacterium]
MKILVVDEKKYLSKLVLKWNELFPDAEIIATSKINEAMKFIEEDQFRIISLEVDIDSINDDYLIMISPNGLGWHIAEAAKSKNNDSQIWFLSSWHEVATKRIPGSFGLNKRHFLHPWNQQNTNKDPIFEPLEKLGAKIA